MIFEFRLYTLVPGRLDVTLARFQDHLPALFADHGIDNVGRWIATAGPNGPMFVYMMAYTSLAERERKWAQFYADPRWARIRSSTQGDEEAVESFNLFFAASNPSWTGRSADCEEPLSGVFDLVLAEAALGKTAATNAFLVDFYLPALERAGARILLVADLLTGPVLPKLALLFHWQSGNARRDGWLALSRDETLNQAIAAERASFGRALLGRTDTYVLEPTDFALPLADLGMPRV